MRKPLSLALAALFAGAAFVACDRLPQQPTKTPESGVQASQEEASAGMHSELVWGNDHRWRFFIPQTVMARLDNSNGVLPFGSPASSASYSPLYVVGPEAGDDGTQAVHGGNPHDHVRSVPPENSGSFSAICNIQGVFASENGDVATSGEPVTLPSGQKLHFAHAADTDGDGDLEQLTSAEKVQGAEALGNVVIGQTPITFTCPVEDIEG